jgi:hypothetical protein
MGFRNADVLRAEFARGNSYQAVSTRDQSFATDQRELTFLDIREDNISTELREDDITR